MTPVFLPVGNILSCSWYYEWKNSVIPIWVRFGSGQFLLLGWGRVGSSQLFLVWVWVWKISPKYNKFFYFSPLVLQKSLRVGSKSTQVKDSSASYLLRVKSMLGPGRVMSCQGQSLVFYSFDILSFGLDLPLGGVQSVFPI